MRFTALAALAFLLLALSACGEEKPAGAREWVRGFGAYEIESLAVDKDKNIYVNTFGGLAKYDPAGRRQWKKSFRNLIYSMRLSPNGDIYLFKAAIRGVEIVKYDSDGTLLWRARRPGYLRVFTVDDFGNVYVVAQRTLHKDNGKLSVNRLLKYDQKGKFLGAANISSLDARSASIREIVADRRGDVYLSYVQQGRDWFMAKYKEGIKEWEIRGGRTFLVASKDRLYSIDGDGLAAYDLSGRKEWVRSFFAGDVAWLAATDNQGNIYLVGSLEDDMDQNSLTVIKMDRQGKRLWTRKYLSEKKQIIIHEENAVAIDAQGDLNVAVKVAERPDMDIAYNKYVALKLAPSGLLKWRKSMGPYHISEGEGEPTPALIAADGDGDVIMATAFRKASAGGDALDASGSFIAKYSQ